LTVAVTPSIRFSFFSMRAAHEAQVMPPMSNWICELAADGVVSIDMSVSFLM
jgi:hypothetical protein